MYLVQLLYHSEYNDLCTAQFLGNDVYSVLLMLKS